MDYTIVVFLALFVLLIAYLKVTEGICHSRKSMEGKSVIVTGANAGIGLETARDLARRKAKVILACRNLEKGRRALEDIKKSTGSSNVYLLHLDLSSFQSVRKFSSEVKSMDSKLDVLVHNAGIVSSDRQIMTDDNVEITWETNHFGSFLLTYLLMDLLRASPSARIVIVSSFMHWIARKLDFDAIRNGTYRKHPIRAYGDTKLANILFAREFSKRFRGNNITANALHPGGVKTNISDNIWYTKFLFRYVLFYLKTAVVGAQTTIYAAVSEDVEGITGKYFSDCHKAPTSSNARNHKLAAKLWEFSEEITGIKFDPNEASSTKGEKADVKI